MIFPIFSKNKNISKWQLFATECNKPQEESYHYSLHLTDEGTRAQSG